MSEPPDVWFNGRFVPPQEAAVPFYDAGFLQGVAVSERLRTFRGELFEVNRHLDRLENSLQVTGINIPYSREELAGAAAELARRHYAQIDPASDVGLTLFVTPGDSAANRPRGIEAEYQSDSPRVVMHSAELHFADWAHLYENGQPLVITNIRQIPPSCWPPALKCRSRMHYYLADREARQRDRHSRALLLDQDGFVSEASTANIIFYLPDRGLVTPKAEKILPGVTMAVLAEVARDLGIAFTESDIRPGKATSKSGGDAVISLTEAAEAYLVSTSPCIWPVSAIDNHSFAVGPNTVFTKLLSAWSARVGLDILAQALAFGSE